MKLSVSYHGGTRYDITSGSHSVITDQPTDGGEADSGMTPVEWLSAPWQAARGILSASSARGTTSRVRG